MLAPSTIHLICLGRCAPCAWQLAILATFFNRLPGPLPQPSRAVVKFAWHCVVAAKGWAVAPKGWIVAPKNWIVAAKDWIVAAKDCAVAAKGCAMIGGIVLPSP